MRGGIRISLRTRWIVRLDGLAHLKSDNGRSSTERSVRSDLLGERHFLEEFDHGTSCSFSVSRMLIDVKVDFDVSCKLSNVNSVDQSDMTRDEDDRKLLPRR